MHTRTAYDTLGQGALAVKQGGGLALVVAPGADKRANSFVRGTSKGNPLWTGGSLDDRAGSGPARERTGRRRVVGLHTRRHRAVVAWKVARVHCTADEASAKQRTGKKDVVQASSVPGEARLLRV